MAALIATGDWRPWKIATGLTESVGQRRQESNACVIVIPPAKHPCFVRGTGQLSEQFTVHNFAEMPVVRDAPRVKVPIRESLLVLTRDPALSQTLKGLGSDHNIVSVAAETDLAGELVGNHQMGAAIIDAAAVTGAIEQLTEKLKSQFPDLVLIVAGSGSDQTALTAQITSGTVYRFLHKPVSEQRVRLFVDAAWRRHGEELSAAPDSTAPTVALSEPPAALPRNLLFTGAAVVIALLAAGGWLLTRKPTPAPAGNSVAATERD